ncbi:MAG: hypothetical protein KGI50_06635 [Patescibacteria group bacterium]|nr:hypothetical protein [Patescibacteria group bacterium]MDE2439111.1 hypothetical protein [Patescibacteria group bacterium]
MNYPLHNILNWISCNSNSSDFGVTVCVDFDGVINKGYVPNEIGPVAKEGIKLLKLLKKHGFKTVIFTARPDRWRVREFLTQNKLPFVTVTNRKPAALLYIDDRGFHWEGKAAAAVQAVLKNAKQVQRGKIA